MKKIWANKADSFKDAEKFDENYYLQMTNTQRLETVQFLREIHFKMQGKTQNESREGLRRFIKIIKQT